MRIWGIWKKCNESAWRLVGDSNRIRCKRGIATFGKPVQRNTLVAIVKMEIKSLTNLHEFPIFYHNWKTEVHLISPAGKNKYTTLIDLEP